MIPKLQKQHENKNTHIIIMHLKKLFDTIGRTKKYETSKELFRCKMADDSSLNTYDLKMIVYIEKLDHLSFIMNHELSFILQLLP